ncbi:hypothetical protein BKA57DRAFT_171309 [Linnemannia elongata]|nr:hypothetical protein BKA57DRAFT_171309 [Linnemannia elongata]
MTVTQSPDLPLNQTSLCLEPPLPPNLLNIPSNTLMSSSLLFFFFCSWFLLPRIKVHGINDGSRGNLLLMEEAQEFLLAPHLADEVSEVIGSVTEMQHSSLSTMAPYAFAWIQDAERGRDQDHFPLPPVEEFFDRFVSATVFSRLDLESAFNQIRVVLRRLPVVEIQQNAIGEKHCHSWPYHWFSYTPLIASPVQRRYRSLMAISDIHADLQQ